MTRRLLITSLTTTALLAGATTTLPARQGQAGPATVEFVATTADGRPVTDLAAGQLTLRVNNRERAVTGLELVRFDAAAPASALPAPFGTNSLAEAGRAFVFVVDEESLRTGLEGVVRDAILEFEKGLSGRDRVGLFTIPRGTSSMAPTTDRAAFRAAVEKIQGRGKASMSASDRRCHTRDTLAALNGLLAAMPSTGAVSPVIFFSTGMVGASTGTSELGGPEDCFIQPSDFQRLGVSADAARAQFYLVRPEETQDRTSSEGLENVVGVTGGHMLYLGGADGGAMPRIARETASYYIATFTAEGNERSGAPARIELRSARPEITVRARPSVVIPRAAREAITPQSMLRELTVHRGFGLRALGIASRNDGDPKNDMKLVALAEPVDPSVKFKSAAAGLYDPAGKLIAQWTARPEELQRSPMVAALAMPAGQYRLRIAAVDTNGRAATVDYDVFARLTEAGPAKLAGLMVGTAGGAGFSPIVKVTNEQEIIAVFELYGRPEGPFGSLVEIVASADATDAIASAPPQASATPVQDKFLFMAKLPVANLKPGDYVVRARLAFEGQPTGTLTQTIRKQ